MSTVSREDNGVMSSEDSSSPEEAELELGLGLSLSGGFGFRSQREALKGHPYARILTAQDLPYAISSASSSSSSSPSSSSSSSSSSSAMSSSSSSTLSRTNVTGTAGTKRSADSVTAPNASPGHVVGWPPIRSYRINSMVNQGKSLASEELNSVTQRNNNRSTVVGKTQNGRNANEANAKVRTSLFVKVNMDGIAIGRKVDLNAHGCYESLAHALEDMFLRPSTSTMETRSQALEPNRMVDASRCSKLQDGSSEFVLTYEDREGDWMLVGDVPWRMFLSSVKRLRITGTREATGLGKQI